MARAFKTGITAEGAISTSGVLASTQSLTNEGGQIELALPSSGSTLSGSNVTIDIYQNRLRFFESGGTNRGFYIDISGGSATVGSNLAGGSSYTAPTLAGTTLSSGATINTLSGTLTADQFASSNNNNGQNFKVGDDAWIGDINISNTISIRGQQSSTSGYIRFGSDTNGFGFDGTKFVYGGTLNVTGAVIDHIATSAQTSSYTLVLADDGKVVEMNNASANTLTIPTNASVAFPVGTQITVIQTGTGQTSLAVSAGVTLNCTPQSGTNAAKLRAQWSSVTLLKRATDTWIAMGDLTI